MNHETKVSATYKADEYIKMVVEAFQKISPSVTIDDKNYLPGGVIVVILKVVDPVKKAYGFPVEYLCTFEVRTERIHIVETYFKQMAHKEVIRFVSHLLNGEVMTN